MADDTDDDIQLATGSGTASPTFTARTKVFSSKHHPLPIIANPNDGTPQKSLGFDVVVAPTVTSGAYSAGDIMGGLLQFDVARSADEAFLLNELQFSFKSAVTPSLLAVLFSADPTSTTKTDNAAYSLNAADTFKVRRSLPVNALGGYLTDHGTPNTIALPNINLIMAPVSGQIYFHMLLIDLTGVTLTSTSDLQVRAVGMKAIS